MRFLDAAACLASIAYAIYLPAVLWSINPGLAIGASSTCLVAALSHWRDFMGVR